MDKSKRILFIGSFKAPADGKIGGQFFACQSLMNSYLKDRFNFILIDSTLDTIHVKTFWSRLHKIANRFFLFVWHLLFSRVDKVLLFSSSDLSFVEKGCMVIMSRVFNKAAILSPRSGRILENLKNPVFCAFFKLVCRTSHSIVCQSKYWKDSFIHVAPDIALEKFVIIENWLPEHYFQQHVQRPIRTFSKESPLQVVYFNRIEKAKGVYDFLNAMKALLHLPVAASIYGDGTEVEEVKAFIIRERLVNTKYFGWLENKNKIIPEFDLYAFTSHSEGFPNALLEVMALGVPVVATRVGAVNDLIENEKNGFLVNAKASQELALAIQFFLDFPDRLKTFADLSQDRVRKNNSMELAINNFYKLLEEK